MKKISNKNLIFAVITGVVLISCLSFMQSCSNSDNSIFTSPISNASGKLSVAEKTEILNSNEFKDFVDANIEIAALVKSLKTSQQTANKTKAAVVGTTTEGKLIKSYPIEYDYDNFKLMIEKIKALGEKYPSIKKISRIEMNNIMAESVSKSKEFQQQMLAKGLISNKTLNVRQKVSSNEGTTVYYNSANEAFTAATVYSFLSGNECAGFILMDGTAVLYISNNGSHNDGSYPIGFSCFNVVTDDPSSQYSYYMSMYNGQIIDGTFHTHFNGPLYSTPGTSGSSRADDLTTQQTSFPNCTMYILYNFQAYPYYFVDGINVSIYPY